MSHLRIASRRPRSRASSGSSRRVHLSVITAGVLSGLHLAVQAERRASLLRLPMLSHLRKQSGLRRRDRLATITVARFRVQADVLVDRSTGDIVLTVAVAPELAGALRHPLSLGWTRFAARAPLSHLGGRVILRCSRPRFALCCLGCRASRSWFARVFRRGLPRSSARSPVANSRLRRSRAPFG